MRIKATAVLCAAAGLALIAAACTTPPNPGGGTTNFAPIAVATALPTAGAAPLTVDFSGSLSSDPDGSIVAYDWSFGDGANASGATTSHSYTSPGSYTVTLVVKDDKGATGTDTEVVEVSPNFDGVTFVDDSGADGATCGGLDDPCASISRGVARASEDGDTDVYVADGSYGAFRVIAGIDVVGGYDDGFLTASGTSVVDGVFDPAAGVSAAIVARDITTATKVSGLTAAGGDETGQARPALGVHVSGSGSGLTLEGLTIRGGQSGGSATGVLVEGPAAVAIEASTISSGTPTGSGNISTTPTPPAADRWSRHCGMLHNADGPSSA